MRSGEQFEDIRLIRTISTGTPIEFQAIRDKSKATEVKGAVSEVGARLHALDQVDGVDKDSSKGSLDVSNAKLPSKGMLNDLVNKLVPETVDGFATYSEDGKLQSLYTASQDIAGKKELQYQRNEDGSQTYSVATPTGQTTVRETADGRLFMMESPAPSQADFDSMASVGFQEPALAPGEKPAKTLEETLSQENIDRAKDKYKEGVNRRADILGNLIGGTGDQRGDALRDLGSELFGRWNPFKR